MPIGQTVPVEAFDHLVYEYVKEREMQVFFKDTPKAFLTWLETGKLP
jgi:hypothetical protein